MSDDAALARAAQGGDPVALGLLLERHRALLHAVAVGMLGHGPQAEDAVHDTFVLALRHLGELRAPSAARAWLLAILGNVCRAELRRRAPEPVAEVAEPRPVPAVEEAIDRLALRDWVWTAIEQLSPPLRLAVVLRYFTGASSYEAIAEVSGVPVGTVRSRLSSARAKLADALLATAAASHERVLPELGAATAAAMAALERSGDEASLRDVFTPDLRFAMSDRVERRGRDAYAARLSRDFEDGVTTRLVRVLASSDVAVVELRLINPPDDPLHCPPAATVVHLHDGRRTRRVVSHYAEIPV